MSNYYELYAEAILKKANGDSRAQPWKDNTETAASAPTEEWVEINNSNNNNNNKLTDVRTNAFPAAGALDVRSNVFPDGALDVRTNAFPTTALDVRTNVFPDGDGALDVRSNAFPDGDGALDVRSNAFPLGGGVSIQTNVFRSKTDERGCLEA